ncbi:MAG TPA: LysM domain-containing protein, partial [Ilumatobacteraceae bacterium]|nr:LysM domain-containing protein [Ilumatobacteraceae bacterium]
MFDDDNDQYGFWSDEPTRALDRIGARRKPAGPAPIAPTRRPRPIDPQVGRRQHGDATRSHDTQQVAVVDSAPRAGGLRQGIGHVDPLIRRMGALAIVVALCVPVAMSLRGGEERSSLRPDTSTVAVGLKSSSTGQAAATEVATDPAATDAAVSDAAVTDPAVVQQAAPTEVAITDAAAPATPTPADTAASKAVAETPVAAPPAIEAVAVATTELVCAKDYEVVAGDYWILIAKKVSVSLNEVLAANNATTDTAIYPGLSVCLPSNASTPTTEAPTTAAPATTTKPATTA